MNEEKQRTDQDTARKYDGDKLRFDLISPEALEALAAVYTMGAGKYDDRNWEKGLSWSRVFAAVQRHLWAFWKGEDDDPESGLLHLAHAAWGCFALIHHSLFRRNKDDRPVTVEDAELKRGFEELKERWGKEAKSKGLEPSGVTVIIDELHNAGEAWDPDSDGHGTGLGYHLAAKFEPKYFWQGQFDPKAGARFVYLSHPFASDPERNKKLVSDIAWKISNWYPVNGEGFHVPVVPHTAIGAWLTEDERDLAMLLCLALVARCDEFWLCGPELSEGMAMELFAAGWWDIPVSITYADAEFGPGDKNKADEVYNEARRIRRHGPKDLGWTE